MVGWGCGLKYRDSQIFVRGGWHVPTYLGVWSLGLFSPTFFSTSLNKKKKLILTTDREASLIKKEYCRCGPHPPQVISPRARPPLVKGAGCIGPLFPDFRGWPLWFMASIALRGLQTPCTGGCSWRLIALWGSLTWVWEGMPGTGDCEPTRPVGAGLRGLLGLTAHGLLGRQHPGPRLSHMVGWGWGLKYRDSQIFVRGGWHVSTHLGVWSLGLLSPTFFSTSSKKNWYLQKKNDTYLTGRLARSRRSTVGWVRPHTPYKWPPSRDSPYPLREGRPIGAHLWDSGGQLISG